MCFESPVSGNFDVFADEPTGTLRFLSPPHENTNIMESNWHQDSKHCIRRKLEDCVDGHHECSLSPGRGDWNPTRLLRIETLSSSSPINPVSVQIVLGQACSPATRYMTLSHCWGKEHPPLELTSASKGDSMQGIPVTKLPMTFRDAIEVAEFLHADHIWIDSLCILQDSVEDWTNESTMMGDVYRHSWCNIAASSASNSSEGCFHLRNPLVAQAVHIPVYVYVDGRRGGLSVCIAKPWDHFVEDSHLNRTAWVFPERLLSPRQINFANDAVFFERRHMNKFASKETDWSDPIMVESYSPKRMMYDIYKHLDQVQFSASDFALRYPKMDTTYINHQEQEYL